MDLNYLYQRHQVSLHLAEHAASAASRTANRAFASAYGAVISGRRARALTVVV
ncbi:MAG: hypothetical protein ABIQ32_09595 [Sphingomicrobium sp.]